MYSSFSLLVTNFQMKKNVSWFNYIDSRRKKLLITLSQPSIIGKSFFFYFVFLTKHFCMLLYLSLMQFIKKIYKLQIFLYQNFTFYTQDMYSNYE